MYGVVTKSKAIAALSALAQESRLDILRLLVARGPQGLASGEIGARTRMPTPTLAFHLNQLKYAGLVSSQRQSRLVIYTARFPTLDGIIKYLSENYSAGHCEAQTSGKASALMPPERPLNVLFLCTRNSARSIMAECAMNHWGHGKFRAFSGGSHPNKTVHPLALELLKELNYDTDGLRSKSWEDFARPDGLPLDFVFTLCDRAAAEACPTWPGQPITAHWGVNDPVAFVGSPTARHAIFRRVYVELEQRIRIFTSLPIETLERFALERWVSEIGKLNLAA